MTTTTSTRRTIGTMPAHARVWVYKSAKTFAPEQREAILARGAAFTASWAAHGAALDACVDVLHDHFVVIAADEQQAMASGCSIDKSVQFVQALESDLGLRLTDRMVVPYEKDGTIATCRVPDVEALIKNGELSGSTIVFDDLVSNVMDLRQRFRVPLHGSWMARWL